jgi:LuxR family maltose regulon positive regulatory protein
MAGLLRAAASSGIAPGYARTVLAAFEDGPKDERRSLEAADSTSGVRPSSTGPAGVESFVEPLSDREVEVLRLIAAGLTNREIGAKLFLALSTVKVHTRNIYGKLGVHSRMQAVIRARELGLL